VPVFKFVAPAAGLAGGAVINNIMAGNKFEFLPRNGVVRVYASQDVSAGVQGNTELDFTLGNVVVGDDLACNGAAAIGIGPDRNTDLLATGVAMAGDRIQIRAQNTDAALPSNFRVLVEINDI